LLVPRAQKITIAEMRESGPTRLIVYCGDYKCAHSVVIEANRWADDVRLSDLEPKFTCRACGHRGADVRPLFEKRTAQAGKPRPSKGYHSTASWITEAHS
jgi:hypothetical protein